MLSKPRIGPGTGGSFRVPLQQLKAPPSIPRRASVPRLLICSSMSYTACVTGATGFIATELIKQLLEKGYNVHATMRNPDDAARSAPLLALGEALPGNLKLFQADLLQEGSFDPAVRGCRYVFHLASPFFIEAADPQAQLIDPALKGTTNLMGSVVRYKEGIRRVVVTSSVAAVKGMKPPPPKNGSTYSEDDWNDTSALDGEAYWLSKVLAERAAWELAKLHGIDLVTILPNFVMGPALSPASAAGSTSIGFMKNLLEGQAPTGAPVFADVRDVARAHILAVEVPEAKGRYIVSQAFTTPPQLISKWLQERFPQYEFEAGAEEKSMEEIDNTKAQRELGLQITPIQSTFIDMAVTLLQLGIAVPKPRKESIGAWLVSQLSWK